MFRYILKRETLCTSELGTYSSYGIQVMEAVNGTEQPLASISDVSLDEEKMNALIALCNECQLCPDHLLDVIEDHLNENKL